MITRILSAAALFAVVSILPPAQSREVGWLRYPAISPDGKTIVFTFKGDLYRVSAAGGSATPLTVHGAHDFMPVWSRDGRHIAFASDRHGNFDVFVMPADGGTSRRLTFHSAPELPYAFTADDTGVLFGAARLDAAGNRLYPTGSQPELYRVPVAGGRVVQVLTTPAEEVAVSRDGKTLLYQDRKGGENIWRKHHTSAIARDIWAFDTTTGEHRRLTTFAGEDRDPVFADRDQAFYYLSEESGSFNVHKRPLAGGSAQQVTSFKTHPVRFLSVSAGGALCFGYDGQIYVQPPGGRPGRIDVAIAADAHANDVRPLPVTGGARELAVSPTGKEVAFIVRGEVFVTSVEGTFTKRVTSTPEQERGVSFSPDGKAILYASERQGRWGIYETRRTREEEPYFYASTVLAESPVIVNARENYQPAYSPDGKEIAYVEDRTTLRVYALATKQSRTLVTDRQIFPGGDGDLYYRWSPDGQWLLFDLSIPGFAPPEIGVVRADGTGEVVNLTRSGYGDRRARWMLGGTAMLWASDRDGLRAAAQSGAAQMDAYALFFTKEAWDRYRLTKEEYALLKEAEEKRDKAKGEAAKEKKDATAKEATPEPVRIDLDGLETRRARLTIHSSSLGDAVVTKDGETLYYLARFERGLNLWSTNLRTRETKMVLALNATSGSLEWDQEQKSLFLLADGALSKIDPASAKREPITISGEMSLDLAAERRHHFDHVWRRTARTFYTAGYHGADWNALKAAYEKHLPFVGNLHEFAEVLSEMLGELNVSHSGASYSSSGPTDDATAALGVFYDAASTGAGARVEEVVKGGPLDLAGVVVGPGAVIEAIDGEPVASDRDLATYLNRKAGRRVLLAIADGGKRFDVVVRPITLAEENRLLYARWVRRNQDEVDRLSNGQLGYVHVPGMNDGAYRTTFEEAMGKWATRKGLVVDTRFNGGGDLVADLAMFLSGRKFFDYTTDTRATGHEPNFRWSKPSVSLANEANYSDGHCYAFAVKALNLGKLVGMPVPGTCTFAGWESLQDGLRWGVPGMGVKDSTTGRYLENQQTEPDIRVANESAVVARGRDQQLEAAVAALLKEIK